MMTTLTPAALLALLALFSAACDGELVLHGAEDLPGGSDGVGSGIPGAADPDAPTARASLHRLNRLEYNNSVRDLLGTTLEPANDFPPDASIAGLDNVASALSITPSLMDRYVDAARVVVEDAFADRPAFQTRLEEDDARWTYAGIDRDANRIGGIVRLRSGSAAGAVDVTTGGPHTLVVRAQGLVNGAVPAPRLRVSVAGQNFDYDVPLAMTETSFAIELQPGTHPIAIAALSFEENAAENRGNDILFDHLVLRSDALVEGPARTRVIICDVAQADCPPTVVREFARRAWRRPLTPAESTRLDGLLASLQAAGEGTEEAIKLALRAILTSPRFLYRYRTIEDANSAELLDPYVLASRLSYFVWSSTPDERVLAAAADGTLSSPAGIRETIAWMMADPRASALADGFAEQWLDLRHLEQVAPSPELYPEFSERVRAAMAHESKLFFLDYFDNGQPVSSMLAPDFAYRDATLATHLGLPAPAGDGFERVVATRGDRRGVLALTAWLTSRSDTEHSSPIRRGAWVADNMLCAPVPPPPPGLEIGELESAESGRSLRERLEQHRSDPACASCHARLDVLGMGFEVYDAVARPIADPTLDATGELPDGTQFRGSNEMAELLDPQTFVTCVSKKLFSYALGRPADPRDLAETPELAGPTAVTLTLPDLITAIVLSPAFSAPAPLE